MKKSHLRQLKQQKLIELFIAGMATEPTAE